MQEELFSGRVHLDPIESGLELVLGSLEALATAEPDPRERKHVVLDLAAGVGTLLRERLRQEHWSLVFAEPGEAARAAYEGGDFAPVGMVEGLTRLADICGLQAPTRWRWGIESLSRARNQLESRGFVETKPVLAAIACAVVSPFVDSVPPARMTELLTALLARIQAKLQELDSYVGDRLRRIAGRRPGESCLACPYCRMESTLVVDGGPVCLYCGYTGEPEAVAAEYAQVMFDARDERIPYRCPDCRREALLDVGRSEETPWYKCFACGRTWAMDDIVFCYSCGQPFETPDSDPDEDLCEKCRGEKA